MKGKAFRRIHVVKEETDETASNIQARSFVASNLRSMSSNAKMKEEQHRASERPKLENARKLRGI